jgi:hypothetical protein
MHLAGISTNHFLLFPNFGRHRPSTMECYDRRYYRSSMINCLPIYACHAGFMYDSGWCARDTHDCALQGSTGSQQIVIEGPLCEDYYKIRELLYSQFFLL